MTVLLTVMFLFDSAASGRNHSKTTRDTKPSSTDKTKPDTKKHSSCLEDDKPAVPVSDTTKGKVDPTFKITISGQKSKEHTTASTKRPSSSIAQVFNPDEDSEEEEMPPEAKMRMRNMGKETRAAEGPNSFSKGKLGFCNRQQMMMRELDQDDEAKVEK